MSLSTGDIIDDKYRIVRLIGEGGMGAVYEGDNTRIHRRVAIKVLHANVAQTGEAVARFEREAQAAGRIGSEHIVEVLDLGNLPSGDRYMVMEFMDGDSLSGRIKARGRLTPGELYPIVHQLLEALAAAHGAGIIHRDLKPDNVYLLKSRGGRADFVKLLDFGISKFNQLSGDSGFSMTRTGAVMGTPYYMAPEQAKGSRELDHRVDLYAAGVILYESITGEVPFNADTFNELLFKIVLEEARPVEQMVPGVDPNFAAIVNKSMAREPAARFQTAREFQQALEQWAAGAGPQLAAELNASARVQAAPAAHATGHALGTGTPGSWANTGGYGEPTAAIPRKSSAGLWIGLSAVGLLVLGGGAAVAMKMGADKAGVAAAQTQAEQAALTKTATDKAMEDERAKSGRSSQEVEAAKAETEKAKAENGRMKAEQLKAQASAAAAAKAPKSAALTASRAKPAAPTRVDPKPAVPPPPPVAAPASTGRKIRTSL